MAFGALRSLIRPISRTLLSTRSPSTVSTLRLQPLSGVSPASNLHLCRQFGASRGLGSFFQPSGGFDRLTDTRLPKRRPSLNSRRKRLSPDPRGPAAWVKYLHPDQEVVKKPNEGSVKRRNEKKRIKLHRAFILDEKKKRTALIQAAKKRKEIERVERKMAAVARERAWAERLVELKQMEEEKKKKAAMA
ncbi:OLC1v1010948C1 [Oldenlandia corymbosa var. corymbosa]|uniref:OLC1v1010948C1 n=1 Tax=Oldenlandia corymbosa var. corymbosa TaxID=529605 RepID=A0AAV1DSG4_OLDCO|nr:OLC1v1010948C1 [Oldenlandia corymbosa var. corymbosa]